jgi:hypothetical protein
LIYLPVIGEPPVFLGSVQVRDTESCLTSTILGGGGASGTSRKKVNNARFIIKNLHKVMFCFVLSDFEKLTKWMFSNNWLRFQAFSYTIFIFSTDPEGVFHTLMKSGYSKGGFLDS